MSTLLPSNVQPPAWTVPVAKRPRPSVLDWARGIVFNAYFFSAAINIFAFQLLVAFPFHVIPYGPSQRLYRILIAHSRHYFGALLVAISSANSFGPTSFVLTADDSISLEEIVERDESGEVVGFKLAQNSIWIANHQQYADWIYAWIIFYLGRIDMGICIILKASLQWAPILGWAMQFYRFAFIDKSKTLQKSTVVPCAKQAVSDGTPFSLLLFPEGTLVSPLTRPKSAAFAATSGVPDLKNTLLPRSTGLLYCLRSVLSLTPSVTLYDLTIGYPGVPDQGHAQQYYTLQSIYSRREPPPAVHLHLRTLDLAQIPALRPAPHAVALSPKEIDAELTLDERASFQEWTRQRWIEKDELMGAFYRDGEFPKGTQERVEVKLNLRAGDFVVLASLPLSLWGVWAVVMALSRLF